MAIMPRIVSNMSLNDLFRHRPSAPVNDAMTGTTQAAFSSGHSNTFIGERAGTSTGQGEYEDVNVSEQARASHLVASVTVRDFLRDQLTVTDDTVNNRFMVQIGKLVFPIPYDQLLGETERMLAVDPAVPEGDKTAFTYVDDGLNVVVMKPYDKDAVRRAAEQKIVDDAKAEMGKTLTVKRAIIEKGYGTKT